MRDQTRETEYIKHTSCYTFKIFQNNEHSIYSIAMDQTQKMKILTCQTSSGNLKLFLQVKKLEGTPMMYGVGASNS